MYDLRVYDLHRAHQKDLERIAKHEQRAHDAQNGKHSKRKFQALVEDFRNRLAQLAQHI